jgi:hypothetical protein
MTYKPTGCFKTLGLPVSEKEQDALFIALELAINEAESSIYEREDLKETLRNIRDELGYQRTEQSSNPGRGLQVTLVVKNLGRVSTRGRQSVGEMLEFTVINHDGNYHHGQRDLSGLIEMLREELKLKDDGR